MNDCFKHGALRAAAAFITAGVAPAFAAQADRGGQGLVVTGESGGGKTALLACAASVAFAQSPSYGVGRTPTAEEIRARFLLKLWNTYAFLCNYARLDGFDPDAPAIPLGRRTDLDRWILSDLQKLLTSAREGLENFDISSFCLEVERFVDDKLSNWYVRRNRRRFWKGEAGEDKTAAYQTLHECVLTLTRVLAPFIPFITEHMYGNLVGTRREASVHHTPWPQARPELVDDALSAEMEALLRLVSLGLAARNTAKIKVRQPLAVLRIRAGTDAERRAVERFADQMRDELNVKRVELVPEAEGAILRTEVKLNLKAAGGSYPPVVDRVLPDHDRYWQSEEAMAEGSPARILERGEKTALPPVLYLQGTADVAHPRPNLDRFVAAYRKAGGEIDLQLYDGEGEGSGAGVGRESVFGLPRLA